MQTTSKFGRPLTSNYMEIGTLIYDDIYSADKEIQSQKHVYTVIITSVC
jgi:hypothetical protein